MGDDHTDLGFDELRIDDNDSDRDEEPGTHDGPTPKGRQPGMFDRESRDDQLRAELAGVQQINKVIEGVNASLDKARANMEAVSSTVNNANRLLNLWVRILSQTEHNQRLLLSEHWPGATKDAEDVEAEELAKQQEAERRREEARERAAVREREAAAEEARRQAAEKKPARGIRKGATGTARGTAGTGASRGGAAGTASSSSTRGGGAPSRTTRGSRVGRGFGPRGSARGVK